MLNIVSSRKSLFIVIFICAVSVVLPTAAQSGKNRGVDRVDRSKTKGDEDVVKLGTTEVLLSVTVRNQFGRLERGLEKKDFIVAENNKRQDISSFRIQQVPINVLLLLDASGSVFTRMSDIRQAASSFVEALGPEDRVSVVQFADKILLLQDWTNNRDDIRQALFYKYRAGEYTLLNDGLYFATTAQFPKVKGRKVLIMLTDGVDTTSNTSSDVAYDSVTRAEASLYVISETEAEIKEIREKYMGVGGVISGTRGPAQQAIDELQEAERKMMERAEHSGGRLISPVGNEDLKAAYAQVTEELKSQYIITYSTTNDRKDGSFRAVQVMLAKPGFSAYTRQGYYAPKGNAEPVPSSKDR